MCQARTFGRVTQQYKSACVSALRLSATQTKGRQRVLHPAGIEPESPDILRLALITEP